MGKAINLHLEKWDNGGILFVCQDCRRPLQQVTIELLQICGLTAVQLVEILLLHECKKD